VERRILRWTCAALLALGTFVWSKGHEDHGLPTADLHADAPYYYVYLPSLLHGDLDFTDEYKETHNWYRLATTPTGRPGNVFGIGPAIFDAPLFAIGHGLALATGGRGDGFSKWEIRLFTWSSLAWSLGAVLFAYRLVRRRLGGGALAFVGPLACALAGPVVYYAVRQPGYAHPMATFFAAWFVERWDASYDSPRTLRTWLQLGALIGAAALARPQLALWSVLLIGAAIDDVRKNYRQGALEPRHAGKGPSSGVPWLRGVLAVTLPRWAAGAGVALAVFAPQLVAWKVLYGSWYVVPQGADFMRWDQPCWSETLFSSRNGLFPWAPAYAVFAIALVAALKKFPRLVSFLVLGIALQAIANGAVWDWWAGGSFGGRRFDSTFVAFAFGAAVIVAWIAQVVPRAFRRDSLLRERAHAGVALLAGWIVLELATANLHLAARYTTTSVRMTGGEPASVVFGREQGMHADVAAWASGLANLPARALFAWKHDVGLDAYDRTVGVHVLGDTYPGLNAFGDAKIALVAAPFLGDGHAHVMIGLNRRGPIEITVQVDKPATVHWNGERVPLQFHTDDYRRGANDLEIDSEPGAVAQAIRVEAM
jgi:uncharacterized membrane protein YraQ (UPF0718 family)